MRVVDRLVITGNSDRGHLNLTPMEEPSGANSGGVYMGTDGALWVHNGTDWQQVADAGSLADTSSDAAMAVKSVIGSVFPDEPIYSVGPTDVTSASALTQNTLYLWRFSVPAAMTVNKLDYITGGTVDGNVCAAIYSSDGTTLTRQVTSGSVAIGNVSALNTVTLTDYDLEPGVDYFGAFGSDSATAQFRRIGMNYLWSGIGLRLAAVATSVPAPATIAVSSLPGTALIFPAVALRS